MEWYVVLSLIFGALLLLLMSGLPIFIGFMILNMVAVLMLMGPAGLGLFVNSLLETATSEPLVAIPMFVILGELLLRTGGVKVMFEAINGLVGAIRGRLYVVSIAVAGLMGAISGSALASVAVLGRFAYPAMIQQGCNRRLAISSVLSGATLDAILPPSIVGIILATLVGLSIADFLVAGIGPGITLGVCFAAYAMIRCWINPSLDSNASAEVEAKALSYREKLRAAMPVLPLLIVVLLVLGLVMFGFAQPTEAAAAGVVGAFGVAFLLRTLSVGMIVGSCYGAARTTATVLIIIVSSKLFSQLLAFTGTTAGLIQFAAEVDIAPWALFVIMMLIVFFLCMFIDQIALILIMVPIYVPIVNEVGFDPVWFWMIFLVNIMYGGVTPPLGYTLFVFKAAVPEVSTRDLYMAILPTILIAIFAVCLMYVFPPIITYLPSLR